MQDAEVVRRRFQQTLITYLGSHPRLLLAKGTRNLPDLCLSLGKFLHYHADQFDGPHGLCIDQPIDEPANNAYALGKQFCQVGIKFIDYPQMMAGSGVLHLDQVSEIQSRLMVEIEGALSRITALEKKRGGR